MITTIMQIIAIMKERLLTAIISRSISTILTDGYSVTEVEAAVDAEIARFLDAELG
jgi:Na+/H+-dicarboxylate symporter